MQEDYEKFRQAGAKIVVVARHSDEEMRKYWKKNSLPYYGVPDPDARLGRLYGQQWHLLKLGLMPALLVIDADEWVVFSHYSKSMADIPSNETVLKAVSG